jgi:hypothetical protein
MLHFPDPFLSMRRFTTTAAILAGSLLGFAACGDFGSFETGGGGFPSTSTGTGAPGAGGGGGIDTNLGGTMSPGAFNYATLCGEGCVLGEDCATPLGEGGGAGGGGGAAPSGYDEGPTACQLVLDADSNEVESACAPVGDATDGMPCLDSSDCAPGLGCVGLGECRRYCCGSLDACDPETFCDPRPMATGDVPTESTVPMIPVCVKVADCVLLDDTTCPADQTCTVVKSDGTVSCITPGEGTAGDPCQCAAGHVCKPEIDTCFKLCRLDRPDDCPSAHTCQGGVSMYPSGYGVCVSN